jgi:hypothetical protein
MHDIEMHEVSEEFARCWQAAGRHIQIQAQGPLQSWLKANLNPPFLEHLSFRLGNQLFFIRIEDVDGRLSVPGNRVGCSLWQGDAEAIPASCQCDVEREPGRLKGQGGVWLMLGRERRSTRYALSVMRGLRFRTGSCRTSPSRSCGITLKGPARMSWQSNPAVSPSIWFVGESGPEWVVVQPVRDPRTKADLPANWNQIVERCARIGKAGHFASVGVANAEDAFVASGAVSSMPLWRGHAMAARFEGLVAGPSRA